MGLFEKVVCIIILSLNIANLVSTYNGSDPTQETAFYCPSFKKCSGSACRYNRIAQSIGRKTFSKNVRATMGCDELELEFQFLDIVGDSFVGNETWNCFHYYDSLGHHFTIGKITLDKPSYVSGSQVNCMASTDNCILLEETETELIYVAGLPSDCYPWVAINGGDNSQSSTKQDLVIFAPSKYPEVMCYSENICFPLLSCSFRARLLSSEYNIKYNGGVEAQAYCEGLKARVICPEGNQVMCSDNRKCYVYEPSDQTSSYRFNVLEFAVTKPKAAGNDVECKTGLTSCSVFQDNNRTIGFVVGIPESCVSKTESISDNGVFLPQSLVLCYFRDACYHGNVCQYEGHLVSNGVERFSSDHWFTIACLKLKINISCSFQNNNNTNSMCSVVKKCYQYYEPYQNLDSLDVMVLDFKKVSSKMPNATAKIQCTDRTNGTCPIFEETESNVKFVIGFPDQCRPVL